jgi:hypothetical protein
MPFNYEDDEDVSTVKGSFTYQGKASFGSGAISLLMALKVSGVKLTEFNGYGGGGLFVDRGTVTFEVRGTNRATDVFLRTYKD